MRKLIIRGVFNATLWCLIGSAMGWYIGNQGGFRRGVVLMTDFILELKEVTKHLPRKEWDA